MAILTLRPISDTTDPPLPQAQRNGAASGFDCVNEEGAGDADASYLSAASAEGVETSDFFGLTAPGSSLGTIDVLRLYHRARTPANENIARTRAHLRIGADIAEGVYRDLAPDYRAYKDTFFDAPDGTPWTWADLTVLEAGVHLWAIGCPPAAQTETRVTQLWVEVAYTPGSADPAITLLLPRGGATFGLQELRDYQRAVYPEGSRQPRLGHLLSGETRFTPTSHTYTVNLRPKPTADVPAPAYVFQNRTAVLYYRQADGEPVLAVDWQATDLQTPGRYLLQFKAVAVAGGAVDYFPVVEIVVTNTI